MAIDLSDLKMFAISQFDRDLLNIQTINLQLPELSCFTRQKVKHVSVAVSLIRGSKISEHPAEQLHFKTFLGTDVCCSPQCPVLCTLVTGDQCGEKCGEHYYHVIHNRSVVAVWGNQPAAHCSTSKNERSKQEGFFSQ